MYMTNQQKPGRVHRSRELLDHHQRPPCACDESSSAFVPACAFNIPVTQFRADVP